MNDDEPEESTERAADDERTDAEDGVVWQSERAVDGRDGANPIDCATETTDPGEEVTDSAPESLGEDSETRIWDRIVGKSDGIEDVDPADGEAADRRSGASDGSDGPDDDAAPDRIWSTYLSASESAGDRDEGTSNDPRPLGDFSATSVDRDVGRSGGVTLDGLDVDALGSQVLVLGPPDHSTTDGVCARLFQSTGADGFDVVFVTLEQTATERTAVFKHVPSGHRGAVAALEVGVYGTTASPVVAPEPASSADAVTIKRLSDPANVARLGIMISQLVSDLDGTGRPVVLCFHSVTALRSYVDTEQLFQFLHVLIGFLTARDVRAHYHVDPSAHTHTMVRTIDSLFDSIVHVSPEGDVEVE